MPRYKRTADEAFDVMSAQQQRDLAPEQLETLTRLRNMWEFAALMQYIFLFGHVVKIDDDLDIEDLEAECLKEPPSDTLAHIGLQLLKYVSSHRGLTPDIFDEYARRQYLAKAPHRNPFGDDDDPKPFHDMDVYTRIRVLHSLSTWTLGNAMRIRDAMSADEDPVNWRMEPLGWDKDDNAYYVLDDNRLYRRADEPLPPPAPRARPKPKPKPKKAAKSKSTRSSKRRKVEETEDDEPEDDNDVDADGHAEEDTTVVNGDGGEPGYGFTSTTWSLVAITLDEYDAFLADIFRTRDPNERQLRKRIEEEVRPIIEKRAEAIKQKQLKKMREMENLQKMATAKRSGRLADKAEKVREERERREAEEKRKADLRMAHDEEQRQRRIEEGHESRRLTREQRLKEREVKRILHEEELKRLEEEGSRATSRDPNSAAPDDAKRISSRQVANQKEQHKKHLEELADDEGVWYFDCSVCGVHGEKYDDGTHSMACDKCGVWQHSKCHGYSKKQAEDESFTFVCKSCTRQEADANKPKVPPLKLGKSKTPSSPDAAKNSRPATAASSRPMSAYVQRQLDGVYIPAGPHQTPGPVGPQIQNGPSLSPHGQAQGPPGYRYPPVANFAPPPHHQPQQPWQGNTLPPPGRPSSSNYSGSPPPPLHVANGYSQAPHYQQHHYAHGHAVMSAGGHPGYRSPSQYQQQAAGQIPHTHSGQYHHPAQQYPAPQAFHQQPQYQQPNTHQQRGSPSAHQGQGQYSYAPPERSSHLMNGFQSPQKGAAAPATSPRPSQQSWPSQASPGLQPSPKASFPPPNAVHAAQSPVKSSPPLTPKPAANTAAAFTTSVLQQCSARTTNADAARTASAPTEPREWSGRGRHGWPVAAREPGHPHEARPVARAAFIQSRDRLGDRPAPAAALTPSPAHCGVGSPRRHSGQEAPARGPRGWTTAPVIAPGGPAARHDALVTSAATAGALTALLYAYMNDSCTLTWMNPGAQISSWRTDLELGSRRS
ncbi:PHD-finger [Teratosphaeria destructans]|uniref:PHD-finger n=1 Tax=Teratosphaeria destructans TaxID=418781 RepID=A0A9W7SW79_9PEZI|nr:PHD-finger [Teratosphaeria destructans]